MTQHHEPVLRKSIVSFILCSSFQFGDSDDSSDEAPLPYPKPLEHSAFLTPDFSPTEFLSTLRNRHQTLEDLRQDLRTRSQELNKKLLDLVNDKYQDFLGLGDNLKGGEEKIEDVRLGLLGFRREIDTLHQVVAARHKDVAQLIEQRKQLIRVQRLGRTLLDIDSRVSGLEDSLHLNTTAKAAEENLDLDFLDSESDSDGDDTISIRRLTHRIQQYVQVRRLIDKGGNHPFLLKQEPRVLQIKQTLVLDLNNALRTLRTSPKQPQDKILKLLTLYGDLGEDTEAIKIVRIK